MRLGKNQSQHRIASPLIISDDEIAHGVAVLDKVLTS